MSLIHNIIFKQPLDISRLNEFVSTINNAVFEDRGEGTYYYWIEGESTRGIDITIEEESIEVRNTVMSNRYDYELTNKIIDKILTLTDGIIVDENEEQITRFPIFDNDRINEKELRDCEVIQMLSGDKEDIAIYGPKRKVHFGKRLHEAFKSCTKEQLRDKMLEMVLNVNYQIPDFSYGDVLQVGHTKDDQKIMKLLTNQVDCIVGKYDYILFNISDDQLIMITNAILDTMLPSNWELVDEFTIVAPVTSPAEWDKLLNNAMTFNMWGGFVKR